jgi:E3 ubiquitin-protein ligase MARCH6
MFVLSRLLTPLLARAIRPCLSYVNDTLSGVLGPQNTEQSFDTLVAAVCVPFSDRMLTAILTIVQFNKTTEAATNAWTTLLSSPETPAVDKPALLNQLLAPDSAFMRVAEPYFAPIGMTVRVTWEDLKSSWVRLALGDGTTEKVFAIWIGYMVVVALLALYLNVLTVGSMRSAGRAMRNAVRQQLLVVKVRRYLCHPDSC